MVLEMFEKYLLKVLAIPSNLVTVTLFLITVEGTESEIIFIGFRFLMSFQVFFRSLIFVWKKFVKYDSLSLYCFYFKCASLFEETTSMFMNLESIFSTEINICVPDTIQGLLSIVSFCLEFLFKGELNLKNFLCKIIPKTMTKNFCYL